jgi:hypothetical protein
MHNPFRYRNFNEYRGRQIPITSHCVLLLAICVFGVPRYQVLAQAKPAEAEKSPLCTRDNALEMIRQQVDLTKTFSNTIQRITVLIRGADRLWPYQQIEARAIFTEAFELATENEKENEQKGPRSIVLRMQVPDQRYVVIRAVAKRDSAWAKKLTRQTLKPDTDDGEASSTRDSFKDVLTAERLLDSANQLISSDINAAIDFARVSLNYPASSMLTRFLYRFAEVNQQAADQFYVQALAVYGDKPMREFLYLQAYPFALRESIDTPIFASYVVPANFVSNRSLQPRFVQILRRAQEALEVPLDEGDTYRNPSGTVMPGTVHLLQGLMRLETKVRGSLPDLLAPLTQAREKILVSLPVETQKRLLQPGREVSAAPEQTFDEQIELAQKLSNVNDREDLIATLVLSAASEKQSLESVIRTIDKISNSNVRAPLLEWIYFRRATTAVKNRQFEEAERLASQVEGQEQRAYLHTGIAEGLLNKSETKTNAREFLDQAITEATKAGITIFAARTLLTASSLYAKIDLSRSISVLESAINLINRIEAPDFSSGDQTLVKAVERKGKPGQYALRFYMPGLDPESAFREMGKIDFDTSLSQSSGLTDKFQRAMSTLALADVCLQQAQQSPKQKPNKSARP